MPICGARKTRDRGKGLICQRYVENEGDRCPAHPKSKFPDASPLDDQEKVIELDAANIEEMTRKLGLGRDAMKMLEQSVRDPDNDDEGMDFYITLAEQNILRMQLKAEANPKNLGLLQNIGVMIGQLKINQKRHIETEKARLELVKLQRELEAFDEAKSDVLSMMDGVNKGLKNGFYGMDPSPRRSVDAYCTWLGEDISVEQVLAGEHETATEPWDMQKEILVALFWPEALRWTAGEKDKKGEEIYYTGKPDLIHTICVTGNNMGKSYISARCIIFHTYFNYPSITLVTGPRLQQVRDTVSAELRRKHQQMGLPGKANIYRLEPHPDNKDRAYVNFTSAQTEEAFQGHHGSILIILEEASGVPVHIYNALEGMMSGQDCRMLQIGNMTRRSGRFFKDYENARRNPTDPTSHLIQRDAFSHPNYVHREWIEKRGAKTSTSTRSMPSGSTRPSSITAGTLRRCT